MTAASPDGRLSRDSMRRIGTALYAYGIAGLALAAIGLVVLLIAAWRLNGVADRVETTADRVVVLLDRTATVLDDAVSTVTDVASTLDSADPMIGRVSNALTTTVDNLRGLQQSATSVEILGTRPLGGLGNRFGQVADSLDPIGAELLAFGADLSSDADSLRRNVASLSAVADELHALHDELEDGLIADTFGAVRFMFLALLAFLTAVAAFPAVAALWIGLRIRSEVGPAPAA
jgi:hypothetical protein